MRQIPRFGGKPVLHDTATLDVPALNAARGPAIDLRPVTAQAAAFDLTLLLTDANGRVLSRYQRQVRCGPEELLKAKEAAGTRAGPATPGKKK